MEVPIHSSTVRKQYFYSHLAERVCGQLRKTLSAGTDARPVGGAWDAFFVLGVVYL